MNVVYLYYVSMCVCVSALIVKSGRLSDAIKLPTFVPFLRQLMQFHRSSSGFCQGARIPFFAGGSLVV